MTDAGEHVERPDPLRVLAQAILDGRLGVRTEFYENTDGENIAWTEFKVASTDE